MPFLPTNRADKLATGWIINDDLHVSVSLPAGTVLDPRLSPLSETDLNNGLFLLQRWHLPSEPGVSALSIQRDPGDNAPVNNIQGFRTIVTALGTWQLADYGLGDHVPVVGFARIGGYLFEITGTDQFVERLTATINVTASS
jgi:hypothetical protein